VLLNTGQPRVGPFFKSTQPEMPVNSPSAISAASSCTAMSSVFTPVGLVAKGLAVRAVTVIPAAPAGSRSVWNANTLGTGSPAKSIGRMTPVVITVPVGPACSCVPQSVVAPVTGVLLTTLLPSSSWAVPARSAASDRHQVGRL
jgi:hypothetical protein